MSQVTDTRPADKPIKDNKPVNSSTATSMNKMTSQPQCFFCKSPHMIDSCQKFLKKPADEKKTFASGHGLCFGCLRRGHLYSSCRRKNPSLLKDATVEAKHERKTEEKPQGRPPDDKDTTESAVSLRTDAKNVLDEGDNCVHSMILPVIVHHTDDPGNEILTYALLDNQSDACFVGENLLQQLKTTSERVTLELTTVLAKQVVGSRVVRGLVVKGLHQDVEIPLPATYSRNRIPASKNLIPRPETVQRWPHLREVKLHPLQENTEIGLLIGINCSRALLPREVIAAGDDEPYAIRTSLGWGVTGNMSSFGGSVERTRSSSHFAFKTSVKELAPEVVRQMFELEFNERSTDGKLSIQDAVFLKKMEEGVHQRPDGHLELPLPLKEENLVLPNNRAMVEKRLQGLKKKMTGNKQYRDHYKAFMADLLKKGYAEKIPNNSDEQANGRVWYLPHHGVYHPKKPGKLRVVFDCSASFEGQTLNEHLLSGPDLINSLTGVLLRFRKEEVAIICDIEAMFHQVKVTTEYRDFFRFLWWNDGNLTEAPIDYRMTVHLFGATSSPGCANYALKFVADTDEPDGRAGQFIKKNFYVDDGLTSVPSPEDALHLIATSRALCKSRGFNLTKFISNSEEVVNNLPTEIRAEGVRNIDFQSDSLPVERALGVQWCVESDALQFRITLQDKPATRRGLLSTVSSIFDPLGLISPFLLTGKKLIQELCRNNTDWDDPLPDDIRSRWEIWRSELLALSPLKIPRCYKAPKMGKIKKVELHHFSDASQDGYGQCSYLRLIDEQDLVSCSLVFAKSRVAPLKPVTVPRLELSAAVTAVKVSTFLNQELDYDSISNVFWTDSTVVLGYISNEARRFHVFVANRVQQIRDGSSVESWGYINTKDNPADMAS